MKTEPGEVYWVDLGFAGKVRPVLVVSRTDPDAPRALSVCVPLTTQNRGSAYEVTMPRVPWLTEQGVANAQGIVAIEHHRLGRRAGRFELHAMNEVRSALRGMLEL